MAALGLLVSEYTVAAHAALVALERVEQEERRPIRRRRERRRRSCWVRYWLSQEQMKFLMKCGVAGFFSKVKRTMSQRQIRSAIYTNRGRVIKYS